MTMFVAFTYEAFCKGKYFYVSILNAFQSIMSLFHFQNLSPILSYVQSLWFGFMACQPL